MTPSKQKRICELIGIDYNKIDPALCNAHEWSQFYHVITTIELFRKCEHCGETQFEFTGDACIPRCIKCREIRLDQIEYDEPKTMN